MWVYKSEKLAFVQNAGLIIQRKLCHVDILFNETYATTKTWTQRVAEEPRVPKPERYEFITNTDAYMH